MKNNQKNIYLCWALERACKKSGAPYTFRYDSESNADEIHVEMTSSDKGYFFTPSIKVIDECDCLGFEVNSKLTDFVTRDCYESMISRVEAAMKLVIILYEIIDAHGYAHFM